VRATYLKPLTKYLVGKYNAGWDLTCVDFRICGTFERVASDATLAEFCDRMLIVWPTEQQVRIELPGSDAVKVCTFPHP
jgi:hypothetical protein